MPKFYWTPLHARLHKNLRLRRSLLDSVLKNTPSDNRAGSLLPRGSKVLVAVSGGQDSLCLGKLLLDLSDKWNWQLAIAHCDHQWSTDAGIAQRVSEVANYWQLPFYLKVAKNLKETEAAARKWRYQALVEIAEAAGFEYIVTGHTKSDRAETLLYNLIRGAGADGLAALSWQRTLTERVTLIRPILNVYRHETLAFCQQFDLPIWFDAVNENNKYARNRIRSNLIPYLQENFNPQVEKSLAQTAELLKGDVEYLEAIASKLLETAQKDNKLSRPILRDASLSIRRRAIRQFLPSVMSKQADFEQIEEVTQLVNAPNRSRTSTLPGGAIAEVVEEWIVFNPSATTINR